MQLSHIPLEQLHVSPVNMRHGKRTPDVSDILPSVRARGILQPLLVRPNADRYEIVEANRTETKMNAGADDREEASVGAKPQMTQAMENYVELHRHGVVRLALLRAPDVALRLMVAQCTCPYGQLVGLPRSVAGPLKRDRGEHAQKSCAHRI